jgi:hypothetical protein
MVLIFMFKRKWICIVISIIYLVSILSACNRINVNGSKDNNTTIEQAKVDSDSSAVAPSMATNNQVQVNPDSNSSAKDISIRTKIMSSDKKELKEEDFEIIYKNENINKYTKIEDITEKYGFPEDYEANNQGYISGNAKYRRWNLCYPNYTNPEIRIIVLSEREYVGEEVKYGRSYIVGVYLEKYNTNRGLRVGDELEKVLDLYGKPDSLEKDSESAEGLYILRYSKSGSNIDITLDDDMKKVKYIFVDYNMKKSDEQQSGEAL